MIVAALFTLGGIFSWEYGIHDREEAGMWVLIALICWVIAGLAGAGVITE